MNWTEATTRKAVAERSQGLCEIAIPGVCESRATNMSHRLARSQGGPWRPENILHACGSGTTGCHGFVEMNPRDARERGWRLSSMRTVYDALEQLDQVPTLIRTPNGEGWWHLQGAGLVWCGLNESTEQVRADYCSALDLAETLAR